jgi:hypothetical protein
MALSIGQKAERVLRFLMGLRHPRVARKLEIYGLTDEVVDEGWALLRGLGHTRLPRQNTRIARSPEIVEAVDTWENRWFPIAQATLRRHEPEVHDFVFEGLSMQRGPEVVISVYLFTSRVRQLERGVDRLGEAATRARARLEERGLTEEVLAYVEHYLARLGTIADTPEPPEGPTPEEQKAAEDALWAWYIEWSAIARTVIRNGNMLRALGYGTRRRRPSEEEELEEEELELEEEAEEDAPPLRIVAAN